MASDRREQAAGTAIGSEEELRRRYKAARKLYSEKSGGNKAQYLDAMAALHADAEAYGEPEILFEIRIEYAYSLSTTGWKKHSREVTGPRLLVLRKCLLMWHEEPHRYPEHVVDAMWTQIFRVLDWYIRFHAEPADRVRRLIDEVGRYCPPTRPGARYVLDDARMSLEARCGNIDEVERLWRELRTQEVPRAHFFPAGTHSINATMWTQLGHYDRAIGELAPVLAGQVPVTAGREYEEDLLMPYLHTGRVEDAVAVHQRTYTRSDMKLEDVAAHLEFCARTGNEERGLDVLHRNRRRIGYGGQYVVDAWTAAAAALVCLRAVAKGLDREWVWPCDCTRSDCTDLMIFDFAGLGSTLRWRASRLARRVDGLNGTSFFGERIDALMHAEPLIDRLELPPDAEPPSYLLRPPSAHLDVTDAAGLRAELERGRAMELRRPRIALTHRVMQNAMSAGAADVLTEARFRLLDDLVETGWSAWHTHRFSALRGLLRACDEQPLGSERFDAMWRAVPVVLDESLTKPGAHLRQIRDLLDMLERHCRPDSEDLHLVRWFRIEAAARSGDADATRAALARFRELPPADRYGGRESVLRIVQWWVDLGCDREAIEAMAPLPDDDREDLLLLPYLRAGRTEKARDVHERTYRTASGSPEVSAHLWICAETGLLEHAREIVHRTIDLFHGSGTDDDFTFAETRLYAAGLRICELLVDAGHDGYWTWPADKCCADEDDWTYARLAEALRKSVADESSRWEEVLGTSFHTRAIAV